MIQATHLTPSQQRTLDYVREHGRVMLGACSSGGYNVRSAEALIHLGVLVEVREAREITCDDGHVETVTTRWAELVPLS